MLPEFVVICAFTISTWRNARDVQHVPNDAQPTQSSEHPARPISLWKSNDLVVVYVKRFANFHRFFTNKLIDQKKKPCNGIVNNRLLANEFELQWSLA